MLSLSTDCPVPTTVTSRSHKIHYKSIPEVKKIPKTGAERIRAYRERILAYEREMTARSKIKTDIIKSPPQQPIENKQIGSSDFTNTILYNALSRPFKDPENKCAIEVEISPYLLDLKTTQSESKEKVLNDTKIAKTSAERSHAYRERRKISMNGPMTNVIHSLGNTVNEKVLQSTKKIETFALQNGVESSNVVV